MPHKARITFEMEETPEIAEQLVELQELYTKTTAFVSGSVRFPIPVEIAIRLNLKPGDTCFFYKSPEGDFLSFKEAPAEDIALFKTRKISTAGQSGTLWLCIPPYIQKLHRDIKYIIQLLQPEGFKEHEWKILLHTTDSF